MHENQKVSAAKEAPQNIEPDFDENKLFQIDNISLEEERKDLMT